MHIHDTTFSLVVECQDVETEQQFGEYAVVLMRGIEEHWKVQNQHCHVVDSLFNQFNYVIYEKISVALTDIKKTHTQSIKWDLFLQYMTCCGLWPYLFKGQSSHKKKKTINMKTVWREQEVKEKYTTLEIQYKEHLGNKSEGGTISGENKTGAGKRYVGNHRRGEQRKWNSGQDKGKTCSVRLQHN